MKRWAFVAGVAAIGAALAKFFRREEEWLSWPCWIVWPPEWTQEQRDKLRAQFGVDYRSHKLSGFVAEQINIVRLRSADNVPIVEHVAMAEALIAENGKPVFFMTR